MRFCEAFLVGLAFTSRATSFIPVLFGPVCAIAGAEDARAADDNPPGSAESGTIKLNNCLIKAVKQARLASDRPGVLKDIAPREGDAVKKDQIVVQLMDAVPRANLRVANLTAKRTVEIDRAATRNGRAQALFARFAIRRPQAARRPLAMAAYKFLRSTSLRFQLDASTRRLFSSMLLMLTARGFCPSETP
jgi:hypothetical protein